MTEQEAWYILRLYLVLQWEGQDVSVHSGIQPGDNEILEEAFRLAGHLLSEHDLWAFPGMSQVVSKMNL